MFIMITRLAERRSGSRSFKLFPSKFPPGSRRACCMEIVRRFRLPFLSLSLSLSLCVDRPYNTRRAQARPVINHESLLIVFKWNRRRSRGVFQEKLALEERTNRDSNLDTVADCLCPEICGWRAAKRTTENSIEIAVELFVTGVAWRVSPSPLIPLHRRSRFSRSMLLLSLCFVASASRDDANARIGWIRRPSRLVFRLNRFLKRAPYIITNRWKKRLFVLSGESSLEVCLSRILWIG